MEKFTVDFGKNNGSTWTVTANDHYDAIRKAFIEQKRESGSRFCKGVGITGVRHLALVRVTGDHGKSGMFNFYERSGNGLSSLWNNIHCG